MRFLALLYGALCCLAFALTALYTLLFLSNRLILWTIDDGRSADLGEAVVIDALLLGLFGLQHSGMARPEFKSLWGRVVPTPIERSTYVLASSAALSFVFWQWRPIPTLIWQIGLPGITQLIEFVGYFGAGLLGVAACQIDALDLLGLRQVYAFASGRPQVTPPLQTPSCYRWVRHPIMVGVLVMLWSVPLLTAGRLLFNAGMTSYIFVGTWLEERDLLARFGAAYRKYQQEVPMFLPRPPRTPGAP